MIIDVHHHWMPKQHVDNIQKYVKPDEKVKAESRDGERIIRVVKNGMALITITDLRFKIDEQIKDMDEAGVDVAILSIATWQDWNTMQIAPFINDSMSKIVEEKPERFIGLAHIPIAEEGGVEELDRAIKDLGLRGVCVSTHHDGLYPDEEVYRPFFKKVSDLNVPVFVHPAGAPSENIMLRKYDLNRNLGRAYDLTLATVRILYSQFLQEFPNLRFIIGHLGGMFFALKNRFIEGTLYTRKPSLPYEKLLESCYFDTGLVFWTEAQLMCAIDTLGVEHILLGSDYPVQRGWMGKAVRLIKNMDIDEKAKKKISYENAAKVFDIK